MGKSASSKRLSRGVNKSTTNYEFHIANRRRCFCGAVFFGVFCIFNLNVLAQTSLENFTGIIERGNAEQKRDALIQIRNLENAEASRVAVPLLKDSSEIVRATAASSIIFLPKDESARNLIPLLSDKKPFVRREAAYALGKTQNPAAINSLIQTFQKDKIPEVKSACVFALGEIGDASAIDFLSKILQKKPQAKEEFIRRSAARSIGQIAQIVQTGNAEVLTPETFSNQKTEISQTNTQLVKNFPQFVSAIEVLIQTLGNSDEFPDVKREAVRSLGAIGDISAVSILQNLLNAEDYYLAQIARRSLQKISAHSNQTPE